MTLWTRIPSSSELVPVHRELCRLALEAWPNECMGLVISRGDRRFTVPVPAMATSRRVEADPNAWVATITALSEDSPIISMYHSHPNGRSFPSLADARFATWSPHHILLVYQQGRFQAIEYQWQDASYGL